MGWKALGRGYALMVYAFIFLPVVVLVVFSFQAGGLPVPPLRGLSLQWYARTFADREMTGSLVNSLLVATVSSAVATALGFLAAYGLARHALPWGRLWQLLLLAPACLSLLIVGLGLLIFFRAIGLPASLTAVGIGHVTVNLPLAFAVCFAQMGDHQLAMERAARDLGAAEWQVLLLVAVPTMAPALLAAFALSFSFSWDEFIIAFLLSRFDVTLPVAIWSALRTGLNPATNAAASIVFAFSVLAFLVTVAALGRRRAQG